MIAKIFAMKKSRCWNTVLLFKPSALKTKFLRSYNGSEFTSQITQSWATQKGIRIEYIQPDR